MSILKEANRIIKMKANNNDTNSEGPSKNDVIISIMADLQQHQDRESEVHMKEITGMVSLDF